MTFTRGFIPSPGLHVVRWSDTKLSPFTIRQWIVLRCNDRPHTIALRGTPWHWPDGTVFWATAWTTHTAPGRKLCSQTGTDCCGECALLERVKTKDARPLAPARNSIRPTIRHTYT